jgi:hypothetical protein
LKFSILFFPFPRSNGDGVSFLPSLLVEELFSCVVFFCLLLEVEFERKIQVQIRAMRMEWEYGYTAKNAILFCPLLISQLMIFLSVLSAGALLR